VKCMRTLGHSAAVLAIAFVIGSAGRAWALRGILGQSKDELKLKYDVSVRDLGNGRVFVRFALADEGRLKPIRSVDLEIPGTDKDKDKNGGIPPELSVSLAMSPADGTQVTQFELTKELAQRAQIWLISPALDGKDEGLSGVIHIIPITKYMNAAAAAETPAAKSEPAPPTPAGAPAAAERKN
jgi:hypothetical protein